MPVAAGLAAASSGQSPDLAPTVFLATGAVVAAVVVFSAIQVARGAWADSDASIPEERSQLNVFLLALLAAAILAIALAASRWLKLSLHVAFAVFAATLFWLDERLVLAGLALAGLIAWARLHLGRHVIADVVAGALTGASAGAGLQFFPDRFLVSPHSGGTLGESRGDSHEGILDRSAGRRHRRLRAPRGGACDPRGAARRA
jgi:hypothetical protein